MITDYAFVRALHRKAVTTTTTTAKLWLKKYSKSTRNLRATVNENLHRAGSPYRCLGAYGQYNHRIAAYESVSIDIGWFIEDSMYFETLTISKNDKN
jgi:hypothetical protein